MTAHEEFKNIDWGKVKKEMKGNAIVVDGRRAYSPEKSAEAGFIYIGTGKDISERRANIKVTN